MIRSSWAGYFSRFRDFVTRLNPHEFHSHSTLSASQTSFQSNLDFGYLRLTQDLRNQAMGKAGRWLVGYRGESKGWKREKERKLFTWVDMGWCLSAGVSQLSDYQWAVGFGSGNHRLESLHGVPFVYHGIKIDTLERYFQPDNDEIMDGKHIDYRKSLCRWWRSPWPQGVRDGQVCYP